MPYALFTPEKSFHIQTYPKSILGSIELLHTVSLPEPMKYSIGQNYTKMNQVIVNLCKQKLDSKYLSFTFIHIRSIK